MNTFSLLCGSFLSRDLCGPGIKLWTPIYSRASKNDRLDLNSVDTQSLQKHAHDNHTNGYLPIP